MRFKILFLMMLFVFLLGCSGEEPVDEINIVEDKQEPVEDPVEVVDAMEDVEVVEKQIVQAPPEPEEELEQDFKIEKHSITFLNVKDTTYVVPDEKRYFKEGRDRTHFHIEEGSYIVLGVGDETRVLWFYEMDTTMKRLRFREVQERNIEHITYYKYVEANIKDLLTNKGTIENHSGSKSLRTTTSASIGSRKGFYQPDTFGEVLELNPDADFELFADTKTLGKGVLKIKNFGNFSFFVGLQPGTPIVMDLNGDGEVNQTKISLVTKNGNVIDLG